MRLPALSVTFLWMGSRTWFLKVRCVEVVSLAGVCLEYCSYVIWAIYILPRGWNKTSVLSRGVRVRIQSNIVQYTVAEIIITVSGLELVIDHKHTQFPSKFNLDFWLKGPHGIRVARQRSSKCEVWNCDVSVWLWVQRERRVCRPGPCAWWPCRLFNPKLRRHSGSRSCLLMPPRKPCP